MSLKLLVMTALGGMGGWGMALQVCKRLDRRMAPFHNMHIYDISLEVRHVHNYLGYTSCNGVEIHLLLTWVKVRTQTYFAYSHINSVGMTKLWLGDWNHSCPDNGSAWLETCCSLYHWLVN